VEDVVYDVFLGDCDGVDLGILDDVHDGEDRGLHVIFFVVQAMVLPLDFLLRATL
jgi:hypothetical protein